MKNYMTKPLVILVNEDKGQVDQLSMFLQDNHDILVFNTPEEILDVFSAYCLRVRAVLISVQLTQVKAMDLLKQLKKISVLPEYIMVSTQANIIEAVDALTYGAVDYISWPSDKHLLLQKIESSYKNKNYFKKLQNITSESLLDKLNININMVEKSALAAKCWEEGKVVKLTQLIDNVTDTRHKKLLLLLIDKLHDLETKDEKKTVLIVEDDPLFSEDLHDLLAPYFNLLLCDTGHKVKELLQLGHEKIDVVLLDIYLPDMMGIDLIPDFNDSLPNTGIVIMTGFKEVSIAVSALQNGANDYINKPFFKKDILTKIAMVLQHQYFLSIMPFIQESLSYSPISYKTKVDILTEYCEIKKQNKDEIVMSDIYMFFPEFRNISIPDSIPVPDTILEDGVMLFIEDLQERLTL